MPLAELILPRSLSGIPRRTANVTPETADQIRTISDALQNLTNDQKDKNEVIPLAENGMMAVEQSMNNGAPPHVEENGNEKDSAVINVPEAGAKNKPFVVTWKNLTYTIGSKDKKNKRPKSVFNTITGQIKSGELTGVMGPSGAGKSTLLECVAGMRRGGRFGEISICSRDKIRLAFVPQDDHFFDLLTVREALTFASKFRNLNREKGTHTADIVNRVVDLLSLHSCLETRISKISGQFRVFPYNKVI